MTVAVVTGGSRGIGAVTALLLAEQGQDVVVGYLRAEQAARRVTARCMATGRRAIAVRADVASEHEVVGLFEAADRLGPVGILVNSAGIVDRQSRVDEMSAARIERMLSVNVTGTLLCAREAVRRMSTTRGGTGGAIVNLSSAASRLGSPGEYVDYAASKGAVDTLTIGLAREVAAEGIRVNAVRPGLVDTDIHASGGRPDRIEQLSHVIPMRRGGTPGEVARAIVWLCSDQASYVTGALLDVSGGR